MISSISGCHHHLVIDRTERFGSAEPPNQGFYRTEPNQVKYPDFGAILGTEEIFQKKWTTTFLGILGEILS